MKRDLEKDEKNLGNLKRNQERQKKHWDKLKINFELSKELHSEVSSIYHPKKRPSRPRIEDSQPK